jgi:hypothetical protein
MEENHIPKRVLNYGAQGKKNSWQIYEGMEIDQIFNDDEGTGVSYNMETGQLSSSFMPSYAATAIFLST